MVTRCECGNDIFSMVANVYMVKNATGQSFYGLGTQYIQCINPKCGKIYDTRWKIVTPSWEREE